jgi:hypothetical protein
MRPVLLHLDDALMRQGTLVGQVAVGGGRDLDFRDLGPALRLWSRPHALKQLGARLRRDLPAGAGPALVFSGSGDFHHVTPLLLQRAIETSGAEAVTVLHFDNHPDWVRFDNGAHCGSWVGWAARKPEVSRVITVGVCSSDIHRPSPRRADLDLITEGRLEMYAYHAQGGAPSVELCGRSWPTIEAMGESAFATFLPGRIETEAVYITIDKDVLRAAEAATNWDQGRTSLDFLKAMLGPVLEGHRVIGADVVGDWSQAVYGGGALASLMKRGEAMLDQPRHRPAMQACAANEPVNLELLTLIGAAS